MHSTAETQRRRTGRTFTFVAIVAMLVATVAFAGPAGAQTGWSACPNVRITDISPTVGLPVGLPPGVYEIEVSVGDKYAARPSVEPVSQDQLREQIRIVLHTSEGPLTTAATPDLRDGVAEVTWQGSLGQIATNTGITGLEIAHIGPRGTGGNSLNVHCVWIYRVIEIPMFPAIPTMALTGISIVFLAARRWVL